MLAYQVELRRSNYFVRFRIVEYHIDSTFLIDTPGTG